MSIRVASEVGALERVICHRPGPELSAVTPRNRRDYLFTDLLDLQESRAEHEVFERVLKKFCKVSLVSDLLADVLDTEEGRECLLSSAGEGVRRLAEGRSAAQLARLFIEGRHAAASSASPLFDDVRDLLPPLPNLLFTRDAACVVGERVMIAAMKHSARWTEELIMRALFRYHPLLRNEGLLYDGPPERQAHTSIEGGDVHILREDLMLAGLSERTSVLGISALTTALFEETPLRDVVLVAMPSRRSAIHLDMVLTMLDSGICCAYQPFFAGSASRPVLHLTRGREGAVERDDLFDVLRDVGYPVEPVYCGRNSVSAEREQWASACNMLAVGPGHVLAYDRNEETLAALERDGGFKVLSASDFLEEGELPPAGERAAIAFRGTELVRGGGGPRCMTLPVRRAEVE